MNNINELQQKLENLAREKQEAIKNGQYERGAQIRDEQYRIHQLIEEMNKEKTSYNTK